MAKLRAVMMVVPMARPSRPSVKLTALEEAVMTRMLRKIIL